MSLRMSSLNPNEPRAAKDCRTCNRRRIKCDRSKPTCRKCAIKGLECPGYGLRIRWQNGVASRGKLSGKTLPILDEDDSPPKPSVPKKPIPRADPRPADDPLASPAEAVQSPTTPRQPIQPTLQPVQPLPPVQPFHSVQPAVQPAVHREVFSYAGTEVILDNQFASTRPYQSYNVPPSLLQGSHLQLLKYFDHIIAPKMTWVDGPHNEWRRFILPLALECHPLLLAVLALSAEHLSSKYEVEWISEDGSNAKEYKEQSLRLLANDLRREMSRANAMGNDGPVPEVLATTIVLCNMEMIRSLSNIWRVHWSTVRMITRRWTAQNKTWSPLGPHCRYLLHEAFIYDANASCTTFDGEDQIPGDVVHPDDVDVFVDLFTLIQDVTQAERARYNRGGRAWTALTDMDAVRKRLAYCYERDHHFAKALRFATDDIRADFHVVIDLYHYAALIYACQALFDAQAYAGIRIDWMHMARDALHRIRDPSEFHQSLVWPLFIIGAEAREDPEVQASTEDTFQEIMAATGWRNCDGALEFLRRFWRTDRATYPTWIPFGREQAAQGFTFLVV